MAENLSDGEQTIEKPVRAKRNYVMTDARKAAFERCRKAREEQVNRIQKERKLKHIECKEEKLQKIKADLCESEREHVVDDEEAIEDVEPIPTPKTKPKRTRKPKQKEVSPYTTVAPQSYSSELYHVFL